MDGFIDDGNSSLPREYVVGNGNVAGINDRVDLGRESPLATDPKNAARERFMSAVAEAWDLANNHRLWRSPEGDLFYTSEAALKPRTEIGTSILAHDDCCGCVTIAQSTDSLEVVFLCNECGMELGRAAIPHG